MPSIPNSAQSAPSSAKRPRSKLRMLWRVALLAIVGVVVFLPTILGSKWVYAPLLERLAREKFSLTLETVRLSWWSPIEFHDIELSQTQPSDASSPSRPIVSIRSIKSDSGLLGYLWNGRNLGRIEIEKPRIDIAILEDETNLEKLIQSIQGAELDPDSNKDLKRAKSLAKLNLEVLVRGLSVHVVSEDPQSEIEVVPEFDIDFSYSAMGANPQVLVKPAKILQEVKITQELIALGLDRAIPFLAKSAWFDGSVSLTTSGFTVPLDAPAKIAGEAELTLHEVRSGPSEPLVVGALEAIARMRDKEPMHELVFVDGARIMIQVKDERVFHSGLEAGLPRLDPRLQLASEGYVGLVDQSLDLRVEVPVPVEQIARRESVKKLGVPKVTLPIGGTLDQPEVKWETMRGDSAAVLALIAGRLQTEAPLASSVVDALGGVTEGQADQAISAAVDLVKQIRDRRAKNREAAEKEQDVAPDSSERPEPAPRRPFRDALKKAIQGNAPDQ